jgi:hypothetical protein
MMERVPNPSISQSFGQPAKSKMRFRWKLWLSLASPIMIVAGFILFFLHLQSEYLPLATAAAKHLHEQIEAGEDAQIYSNAAPAFRAALSRDSTFQFLTRVRRKLGKCQYSGPITWQANSTFVVVTYHEKCSNGDADETLKWSIVSSSALLVSMNVSSPALLSD